MQGCYSVLPHNVDSICSRRVRPGCVSVSTKVHKADDPNCTIRNLKTLCRKVKKREREKNVENMRQKDEGLKNGLRKLLK